MKGYALPTWIAPAACPGLELTRQALEQAESFSAALRKLRPYGQACQRCQARTSCPVQSQMRLALQIAVQELLDEWNQE